MAQAQKGFCHSPLALRRILCHRRLAILPRRHNLPANFCLVGTMERSKFEDTRVKLQAGRRLRLLGCLCGENPVLCHNRRITHRWYTFNKMVLRSLLWM